MKNSEKNSKDFEFFLNCFSNSGEEEDAFRIINYCRCSTFYHIGILFGEKFIKIFPNSRGIIEEYGLCLYYSNRVSKTFEIFSKVLKFKNISQKTLNDIEYNLHFCVNSVKDDFIFYDEKKIKDIYSTVNNLVSINNLITFSITTCKRLDLFRQTINSFINCCNDVNLIDKWICVDDNSSESDRNAMKKEYPFFTFYMKNSDTKGHSKSMNIIQKVVKTPYLFHMEDDWKFFKKENYISKCLEILSQNKNFGQCLINKNYGEVEKDYGIQGGKLQVSLSGERYYIHEHLCPNINGRNCSYWPHFSLRPSLVRTKIFKEIGEFSNTASHFEMEYAYRYVSKGYLSVFLEGISCLHIGRLTSERNDETKTNAYILNNEEQFTKKEEKELFSEFIKNKKSHFKYTQIVYSLNTITELPIEMSNMETFIVNLDRRIDRMKSFAKRAPLNFLGYINKLSAIDGKQLVSTPQLQQIFNGNDYFMRKGIIGCALSHILLYINLINSSNDFYMIIEDDVRFVKKFPEKLIHICKQFDFSDEKIFDWDIIYLGHSIKTHHIDSRTFDKNEFPILEKWSKEKALEKSFGGTTSYLISKNGAKRLLEFINRNGMTNAIDTMQQKSADELNVYYCSPHLVIHPREEGHDTDVQVDYEFLCKTVSERMKDEVDFYEKMGIKILNFVDYGEELNPFLDSFESFQIFVEKIGNSPLVVFYRDQKISDFLEKNNYKYFYTLENKIIVIVINPTNEIINNRYFDRLKIRDVFNISDAIKFLEKNKK
jgi:GR25 family glycosyltransferase involved in LPS biosynthesis